MSIDKSTFLKLSVSLRSAGMSAEQVRAVLGIAINAVRGTPEGIRADAFRLIRATRVQHAQDFPFGKWASLYKVHGRKAWYFDEESPEVEAVNQLMNPKLQTA